MFCWKLVDMYSVILVDLYKQVRELCRIAQTTYIFPTGLRLIFRFFLKSMNLK